MNWIDICQLEYVDEIEKANCENIKIVYDEKVPVVSKKGYQKKSPRINYKINQ